MLKREDGRIDWAKPALEIYNRIRGFTPWPGAYTEFRGQTCHVWGRPLAKDVSAQLPGTLLTQHKPGQRHEAAATSSGKLLVACGAATVIELTHVKLEGRRQISAAEFANGARLRLGERFGEG